MKRCYCLRKLWSLLGVLIGMVLLFATSASAQAPNIEGTYKFISRQLPDGTMLKPPDIMGLWIYSKGDRSFNFIRKDASGKFASLSLVSTYKLTATEYSETLLFSIRNNQIDGNDIVYDVLEKTRSVPVKMENGRIQFKLPFERPMVMLETNKITATGEGGIVDVWEKVQ
jgi:hypothetical protein